MCIKLKISGIAIIGLFLFNLSFSARAQSTSPALTTITIDQCYSWTRENYPLIKQLDLIEKTTSYSLSNAAKGNLPQIGLSGQASYQSDVTALPIRIPNVDIPVQDKDQYKIYGEIYQPLTQFSQVHSKKELILLQGEIDKQKIEIDLYKLKERINQLYFGTLFMNSKIEHLQFVRADLDSALTRINAAITNGTATQTDQQLLQVERVSVEQQVEEIQANKRAFLLMLSALTGQSITISTVLQKPISLQITSEVSRPELRLFDLQKQSFLLQSKQLNYSLTPNVGMFAQGGYGRPALNFLSNEFSLFYVVGVKFNWNLSNFYTYKNTKSSLNMGSEQIAAQEQTFLLNTSLTQFQQSSEIDKYKSLINADNEIITIREAVMHTARVQLNEGIITTLDYVKYLNDVNKARQLLSLHESQWLLSQYNLKITNGY